MKHTLIPAYLLLSLSTPVLHSMYLNLSPDQYGIAGLFQLSPSTAPDLRALAQTLLCSESTLSRGDRELMASYVSHLNGCTFCCESHSAIASALSENTTLVQRVKQNPETAPISPKLKALLAVAHKVQQGGSCVTPTTITRAYTAGATEKEVHDTVLIAAAFCMFNRYVDGLGAWTPLDTNIYKEIGAAIAKNGYLQENKN